MHSVVAMEAKRTGQIVLGQAENIFYQWDRSCKLMTQLEETTGNSGLTKKLQPRHSSARLHVDVVLSVRREAAEPRRSHRLVMAVI